MKPSRASDFPGFGMLFVGDYFAAREHQKIVDEVIGLIALHIDSIVGNRCEGTVFWRGGMPIELHDDAARPSDQSVYADGILEWLNNYPAPAERASRIACSMSATRYPVRS
jgi:hypothetical protein